MQLIAAMSKLKRINPYFLRFVDNFVIKQAPKCSPEDHFHPGIQECHPKPPLPGSWHRDPKIRHTKESASAQENIAMNPETLEKIKSFSAKFLDEESYIALMRAIAKTKRNIPLSESEKQQLQNVYAKVHSTLSEIHKDLSQPIDDIVPFNEKKSGINAVVHEGYFSSILDTDSLKEKSEETKQRIATELSEKLRDNAHFEAFAQFMKEDINYGLKSEPFWSFPADNDIEGAVAELIHSWAVSSADSNKWSIMIQEAVAEEFELDNFYESSIRKPGVVSRIDLERNMKGLRAFVAAVYDHTQEWLKKHNIDSVILYRGMSMEKSEADEMHPDEEEISLQPISSFSTSRAIANEYAGIRERQHAQSAIRLGTRVPANKIFSTAQTGFGCKDESEMLIFGGMHRMAWEEAQA